LAVASNSEAQYAVGSLVRTRGRDWIVLPSEDSDVLRLRPLTGSEEQTMEPRHVSGCTCLLY